MLDLETLGHKENAVIIQIGACYFNENEVLDTFFRDIDAKTSINAGFEMSVETIDWWMKQRVRPYIKKGISVQNAITEFNWFIKKANRIWCHVSFDCPIIMNHFNRLSINPKIHHTQFRDLRTLVDLAKLDVREYPDIGVHHNALDDCLFQVQYCIDGLKRISNVI